MENEYKLTARQVLTRIISVIVAGIGGSACGYSLLMQVAESGLFIASATWFAGLFAVVFALAGYAVSCDPGAGKSYIPLSVTIGFVLIITGTILSRLFLYVHMVIYISLIAAAVQMVVLVIYHFLLKKDDPDAL